MQQLACEANVMLAPDEVLDSAILSFVEVNTTVHSKGFVAMIMAEGESRVYSSPARLPYTASNRNPASSTNAFNSATVYARTECSHDSRFPSGKMTVFFQFNRPPRASNCHSLSTMISLIVSQAVGLNSLISFSLFQKSSNSLPPGFKALWMPCSTSLFSFSVVKKPKDTNILSTTSNDL